MKRFIYFFALVLLTKSTFAQGQCPVGQFYTIDLFTPANNKCVPCPSGCKTCEYNHVSDYKATCLSCDDPSVVPFKEEERSFNTVCVKKASSSSSKVVTFILIGVGSMVVVIIIGCVIAMNKRKNMMRMRQAMA